jgi:protein-S-isoprenylcysteine O-methyltransferase Ste14
VVDSGIYAVVRHPMYLGLILVLLATILISQHWLTALFSVPWILLLCNAVRGEDKRNSEKFGDDYKRYMQSVPRMNLPVGLIRLLLRKTRG